MVPDSAELVSRCVLSVRDGWSRRVRGVAHARFGRGDFRPITRGRVSSEHARDRNRKMESGVLPIMQSQRPPSTSPFSHSRPQFSPNHWPSHSHLPEKALIHISIRISHILAAEGVVGQSHRAPIRSFSLPIDRRWSLRLTRLVVSAAALAAAHLAVEARPAGLASAR